MDKTENAIEIGVPREGKLVAQLGDYMFHIDSRTKEPAYSERYQEVCGFREGLAPAARNGEGWFHIDHEGKPAYQQRFEWVGSFREGLAPAKVSEGCACHIRHDGTAAYKSRFRDVSEYCDGIAVAHGISGEQMRIDRFGNLV